MKRITAKYVMFPLMTFVSAMSFVCLSQNIQPYKSQEIQPYKAQEIQPARSQDIQQYNSGNIKPYKSQRTETFKSKDVNPSAADSPKIQKSENPGSTNTNIATIKSTETSEDTGKDHGKNYSATADAAPAEISGSYFGLYQYWVPGASYTTPDYTNNQLVIHNSSGTGVLPGGIRINGDGTFIWNSSWDGKVIRGKWRKTGDGGYPIEMINAQEGKNWKVGKGDDGNIIIWDGFTWYNGKKIKN
jgi:hypothetical protein